MARKSSKTKSEKLFMPISPNQARDIQSLSTEAGTSVQDMVATLIWLGKKALGRRVRIAGKGEGKELDVSFEKFNKISSLDD